MISILFASMMAFASLPPTTTANQGGAKSTTFNFEAPLGQFTKTGSTNALIETGNYNLLKNPGFEAPTAVGWTASGGTATVTSTAANVGFGIRSGGWDSSASAQTYCSDAATFPLSYRGQDGAASIYVQTPTGTATHNLVVKFGSTTWVSKPVGSGTNFFKTEVTFKYPTDAEVSGTPALANGQICLQSVAVNEPQIYIDDAHFTLKQIAPSDEYIKNGNGELGTTGWFTYEPLIGIWVGDVSISGFNNLAIGTPLYYTTTGTPMGGLTSNTQYYVVGNGLALQLSATLGGSPIPVSSAGTGTHYFRSSTPYATFSAANADVSMGVTYTNPLLNTQVKTSLLFNKLQAAVAQGSGAAYDFTIDDSQKAKVLQISFQYLVNSGTFAAGSSNLSPGDVTVWILDKTNNRLIQPSSIGLYSNSSTLSDVFTSNFQTSSDSTSYRLIVHNASLSASAFSLKLGAVSVKPSKYVYGTPITDWVAYTPAFTGGTVGNGTLTGFYRRVGDSAEVRIIHLFGSTGTSTSEFRWGYPPGINLDTSKIPTPGTGSRNGDGTAWYDASSTSFKLIYSWINLSSLGATVNGTASQLSNTDIPSGQTDAVSLYATFPVVGWSSSVQMSDGYDGRVIVEQLSYASYSTVSGENWKTSGWAVGNSTIGSARTDGKIYPMTSGWYQITFFGQLNLNANNLLTMYRINGGSPTFFGGKGSSDRMSAASQPIYLNGSDYIEVGLYNNGSETIPAIQWSLSKANGSPTISATETVSVILNHSSGQSIPNAAETTVTGWTKEEDTHSAFNAATGEFRAPTSGLYEMDAILHLNTMSATGTRNMTVTKNGSIVNVSPVEQNISGQLGSLIISSKVRLIAGDTIKFTIYQGSGSAVSLMNAGVYNHASITKIGL
jgi:hypothetical protein